MDEWLEREREIVTIQLHTFRAFNYGAPRWRCLVFLAC